MCCCNDLHDEFMTSVDLDRYAFLSIGLAVVVRSHGYGGISAIATYSGALKAFTPGTCFFRLLPAKCGGCTLTSIPDKWAHLEPPHFKVSYY